MSFESTTHRPPRWYQDAVIYEVHVRAFADSNDDGIGDFPGLTAHLDYLSRLGVNAIWVLPFYPSPLRDDGYDIAEYYDVHPSYGTLDDFKDFLDAAHSRDMRVITEVVINHTSDQHSWFQRARRADPGTPERGFYVWSDTPDRYADVRIIFQDTETSNWTWDPVAGAYYWHRFFSHQPDLNYDNPLVHEAVTDVLRFWLDMGVDGVRLDAIPYLFEREGTNGENLPETHDELKRLRAFVDEHYDNRMLLAEANQWPEDSVAYFGDGDECHMAFHFPLMPRLYLALERESRLPIIDILEQTPPIPDGAQWAIFLRNHDELTLEMVSEEERDFMWQTYAPDRRARLNLGIRRRLAPLLENDRRRIELLMSLLLSLPGTPVLYYGDEIGMGDNIFLADRDGVRTPMQWSSDRNAGFSKANPQSLYLPVVVDPQFHYETVNVEAQHANPNSLLWWIRGMIRRRHSHPVFGRGSIEFLAPQNDRVLAYLREDEAETILVVANLSRHAQFVEIDLSRFSGSRPMELPGRTEFPMIGELPYLLTLGPYGFYWLSLRGADHGVDGNGGIVRVTGALEDAFADDGPFPSYLAGFIERHSWYRGRYRSGAQTRVFDLIPMNPGEAEPAMFIAIVEVEYASGPSDLYVVPVAIAFDGAEDIPDASIIARIERDGQHGVVFDALRLPAFRALLLDSIMEETTHLGRTGSLTCASGRGAQDLEAAAGNGSRLVTTDRGETDIEYGAGIAVKLYRHIEAGNNPDVELRRFLTDRTGFERLARVYGSLDYRSGATYTIGVLQESATEGDTAWTHFERHCARWLRGIRASDAPPEPPASNWASGEVGMRMPAPKALEPAVSLARRLAAATAELHLALASLSEDPDMRPEPFSLLYQHSLYQSLRAGVRQELRRIRRSIAERPSELNDAIHAVVEAEPAILAILDPIRRNRITGRRIRLHGDYRLDEVRTTDTGFRFVDFSGDLAQPLSERRLRGSPLRDVAQMLRSFDYLAVTTAAGVSEDRLGWAPWWSRAVGLEFLDAYLEAMGDSPALPDDREGVDSLLAAFELARALRELHWELDMRPEWVHVPLAGVRRMLGVHPSIIR
jgi:maltose alpha-D-glucosyltransferase/alpha-amylase